MPIYEYRCDKCGIEKEYLQKVSDPPVGACPCGESTMTKLISAAGFQLKGSGWYATDFKNSGSKPAAKKEDGGASADGDKKASTDGAAPTDGGTPAGTGAAAGPSPA